MADVTGGAFNIGHRSRTPTASYKFTDANWEGADLLTFALIYLDQAGCVENPAFLVVVQLP